MADKVSRAVRRHHRERFYRKTVNIMKHTWGFSSEPAPIVGARYYHVPVHEFHVRVRRHQDNRAICSCHGCGNPRRYYGKSSKNALTMQERRALEGLRVDFKGLLEDSENSLEEEELINA